MPGAAPIQVRLDPSGTQRLREAIDEAVALGASGGEGRVAEFESDGATVIVSAGRGGTVRLHVHR